MPQDCHDIAMTIYGLYLFHFGGKDKKATAFDLFLKASSSGLAIADYVVACCYHHGYGIPRSFKKSRIYFMQFKKHLENNLRQKALALHMNFKMKLPSQALLYAW